VAVAAGPRDALVARYAELFRAEAREHVAELSQALVALERTGAPEWIDVLFRAAHTLKGMCATMGYSVSERLAHALEELLAALRSAGRAGTEEVALLFRVLDVLEPLLLSAAGARDSGAPAIEPLVDDLVRRARELAPRPEESAAAAARGATAAPTIAADPDVALTAARSAFRPAAVVRVPRATLDGLIDLVGELVVARDRHVADLEREGTPALRASAHTLGQLVAALRDGLLDARVAPVGEVLERMHRVVRDAARTVGRTARLVLVGGAHEVDRAVLDTLGELLVHLVRNAVDHGLEPDAERVARGKPAEGTLEITARRRGAVLDVIVADDGRGIDRVRVRALAVARGLLPPDAPRLDDETLLGVLAAPGFTTRDGASRVSGRGVGIDAVVARVRQVGGTVRLASAVGAGTTITLSLPATLALQRVLVVAVAGTRVALPVAAVDEVVDLLDRPLVERPDGLVVAARTGEVPAAPLATLLGLPATVTPPEHAVTLHDGHGARLAVAVDRVLGQHEVVLKRWAAPRLVGTAHRFTGGTILGDGLPALIVDVGSLPVRSS
jgi:two-component system chemotaxis sensor kinase CheA